MRSVTFAWGALSAAQPFTINAAEPAHPVTFAKEIAPILQKKCKECRRKGSMAAHVVSQSRRDPAFGPSPSGNESLRGRCLPGASTTPSVFPS
jgi:hypothetical protein